MAGKSTISITFKLDGDAKGFKDLAKDAEGLKAVISSTVSEAQQLKGNVINFAALATGINATARSFSQLEGGMKTVADAYAVQEMAETKLATVMAQRMGATEAEIQSIKELCAAQQQIGVIGDEVQLSGAQQIATFLQEKDSLETLIPAMNNLLAQQKGLNATTGDAQQIGNLFGKVMQGQVDALKRVGISFSEAEANVLKYGTEQERAAMLAQVVQNNVGNMNAELAKTESGKQQQLANAIGDVKEQIGGMVNGALPFVTIAAQSGQALASVITLTTGFKTLTATLYTSVKAFALSTAAFVKNKAATLAAAAAQKVVAAATAAWTGVQKILNLVLTANPIGLLVAAIGALVAAVIAAYNNCESFRQIVDKVWGAIKPLANAIMNGLAKAFEWLVEKCKEAWQWLKNILGLGGKKVEVAVEVSKPKAAPGIDLEDAPARYANAGAAGSTPKAPGSTKAAAPVWNDSAANLKDIGDNIEILQKKLQTAGIEEAALINQQIEQWQAKADAIENAGKAATDNGPLWKEDAANLKDINDNIEILRAKLQTAGVEEAALINQQIEQWQAKADVIENAGKAAANVAPLWKEDAANLKDIGDNIQILESQLQTATIEEAALINQQIDAWNAKAEAIRNAGKEAEKSGVSTSRGLLRGWDALKGMGSSIQGITDALKGNGSAWQIVVGIIDGFIGLYEGIQTVVGIIELLTGASASAAHAATKGIEATIRGTTAATSAAAASTAVITANKLEAASFKELAASEYMAAHAYIPFAGFGIAMGFTTAMLAAVTAAGIPMLADGGVASGPTLAMVGEYAGASGNPEVIAPLDKLRGMLAETGGGFGGEVEFKIKGRTLVGILSKENNLTRRS